MTLMLFALIVAAGLLASQNVNAQCASNDPTDPVGIIPVVTSNGNPALCEGGFRINDPVSGATYNLPKGGTVKVVLSSSLSCGPVISWEASPGVKIDEIIVKGGPVANSYSYLAINPRPLTDGNLHAPIGAGVGGNQYYGVSHIDFCYTYVPPPTLSCDVEVTDVTCYGLNDGTATAVPKNFTGDLTYEWRADEGGVVPVGQENNKTITGLKPGVYIVRITDSADPANPVECNEEIFEPAEIILTCPPSESIEPCSTDAEIKAAFDAWLLKASATQGEVTLTVLNNWDGFTYPDKCGEVVKIKFYVVDECADPCEATFTVLGDEEAPVIRTVAKNDDLGCNPMKIVPPVFTGWDNCDGAFEPVVTTDGAMNDGCKWSQTWKANYTDECENPAEEVSITYTWKVDTEAPVLANVPVGGELGCNPKDLPACDPAVTAEDVCDGTVEVKCKAGEIVEDGCLRSQTFTYSAMDACKNTVSKEVTYTWSEVTAPKLMGVPEGGFLGCIKSYWEIADKLRCLSYNVTAYNECGPVEVDCSRTPITQDGCEYTKVITWSATACGLTTSVDVTFTWKLDNEKPVISTTAVSGDLGCNPTVEPPVFTGLDNCDGEFDPIVTAISATDGCNVTTTWFANYTDDCGNVADEVKITYTYKTDKTGPVMEPIEPLTFACGEPVVLPVPVFNDECDGEITEYTCSIEGYPDADCATFVFPVGTTTVCFTAVDECGNPTTECVEITVESCACETAFARSESGMCFIPEFNRWGWTNMITPGTYTWPLWAAAGQCDISKGTKVGTVTVVYTDGSVSVTYNVEKPYYVTETHTYAGTDKYPQVKQGRLTVSTVAPGSYYIKVPADGKPIYVIAHAVVCGPYPMMKSAEIVSPVAEMNSLKVYPNPFSDKLNFEFVSDKSARAVIEIFNMTGQSVTRLLDQHVQEGVINRVEFAPTNIISGMYMYKLTIDGNSTVGKVIYRK